MDLNCCAIVGRDNDRSPGGGPSLSISSRATVSLPPMRVTVEKGLEERLAGGKGAKETVDAFFSIGAGAFA